MIYSLNIVQMNANKTSRFNLLTVNCYEILGLSQYCKALKTAK